MRMMGGWMWMMFVFFSFHAILSNLPSYDDCDVNAGVTLQMTLAALGVNVVEKCEQQFFQFLHSHTHTNTQSLTAEYVRRGRAGKKFTDQPIRQRRSSSQSIYCNFMIWFSFIFFYILFPFIIFYWFFFLFKK